MFFCGGQSWPLTAYWVACAPAAAALSRMAGRAKAGKKIAATPQTPAATVSMSAPWFFSQLPTLLSQPGSGGALLSAALRMASAVLWASALWPSASSWAWLWRPVSSVAALLTSAAAASRWPFALL